MTALVERCQESTLELLGLKLRVLSGGKGRPVVVLHHDIASPGWTPFYERLAAQAAVYVPDLPGYGQSERPEWARHPRDLAAINQLLLDRLDLSSVTLVGLGFGGWIAAEMAVTNQRRLSSLVLVGAMGIQPAEGEIVDQMLISIEDYVAAGFATREGYEQQFGSTPSPADKEQWDFAREMTARIAWKPYMFSRQLPHLLSAVEVPTLIVWGRDDRIVPADCGRQLAAMLPNSRLETVDGAGHFVDLERPEELADLILREMAREA